MVVRKRKKKDKQRGMRTHGKGNTKNSRGAGSRGGRGRAGSHKHKYSKYYDAFGGQKAMKPRPKNRAINLCELDLELGKLVAKKKVELQDSTYIVDGRKTKISKILARGNIEKKLVLKNISVSKKALKKIEAAGGKLETVKAAPGEAETENPGKEVEK